MFEKELDKFRRSVSKTIVNFFGKKFTVTKAVEWEMEFLDKFGKIYDVDGDDFKSIKPEHRSDVAKYRTLKYFMNVLLKLNELEDVVRSVDDCE